jgi:hypothetical protein
MIGLLEYRDGTFKTEDEIRRVLQLPVLALVPMMQSDVELRNHRRRRLFVALIAVVMAVGSAVALVVWERQGS